MTTRVDISGATTDAHLLDLWLAQRPESTVRVYRPVVEAFLDAHPTGVRELTVASVIEWSDALTGADATRARLVATLKSFLTFAWRTGYTTLNVGRLLRCVKVADTLHERLVSEADLPGLLAACAPGRDQTLVRLLYVAGLRLSEALRLRFLDVTPGRVTVIGKGKKTRTLVLPVALTDALVALRSPSATPQTPVFLSKRGSPLLDRNARQIVTQAADDAGLALSPHWLRHAHASHALDRGAPLHVVRDSLGHANISTTSRYLHARPNVGASQFLASV